MLLFIIIQFFFIKISVLNILYFYINKYEKSEIKFYEFEKN